MQELEVLISIQPDWIELIAQLIKTIEVRKTRPTLKPPFKCLIYCTQDKYKHLYDLRPYSNGDTILAVTTHNKHSLVPENYLNGKVIGEFICDKIEEYNTSWLDGEDRLSKTACLSDEDIMDYMNGYTDRIFYAWHISDLKIYDKPKELSEFKKYYECGNNSCGNCNKCDKDYHLTRPPQSWFYISKTKRD